MPGGDEGSGFDRGRERLRHGRRQVQGEIRDPEQHHKRDEDQHPRSGEDKHVGSGRRSFVVSKRGHLRYRSIRSALGSPPWDT